MANLIPEEPRHLDPNDINAQIREYVKLKASEKAFKARSEELREKIVEFIDAEGVEDSSGNIGIYLDEDVDGVIRLQKTRRAKRVLNEEVADAIIAEAGIADDVYEFKRTINEGALMSAFYNEQITEDQLDAMFPVDVQWALNTLKK